MGCPLFAGMPLLSSFRKFVGGKCQHDAYKESADVGKKIHPFPIAIGIGLYELYEATVKSKNDDDDWPSL